MEELSKQLPETLPAIKALGSLFKLTEVFLWENSIEYSHIPNRNNLHVDGNGSDIVSTPSDGVALIEEEDMELSRRMNELGLPLSFHTNKNKMKNVAIKGKRKVECMKQCFNNKDVGDGLDSFRVSEEEVLSPNAFQTNLSNSHCCLSMLDRSESSCYNLAVNMNKLQSDSDEREDSATLSAKLTCEDIKECCCNRTPDILPQNNLDPDSLHSYIVLNYDMTNAVIPDKLDSGVPSEEKELSREVEPECLEGSSLAIHNEEVEQPLFADMIAPTQSPDVLDHEEFESCTCYGESGEWKAYWDSFYMRYYFYNTITLESIWYPPPGLEHLASDGTTIKLNELNADVIETDASHAASSDIIAIDSYEESSNPNRLAYQSSSQSMVEMELAADDPVPGIIVYNLASSINDTDKLYGGPKVCNVETGSCFISGAHENIDGRRNKLKQHALEDVCCMELHQTFMNKKDEQDSYEFIGKCRKTGEADALLYYSDVSSLTIDCVASEDDKNSMHQESIASAIDNSDTQLEVGKTKRKKKAKRTRTRRTLSSYHEDFQSQQNLDVHSADITKYWCQRYLLFSKFDKGIKMDEEGWYSVTPELIARHHASRCGSGIVVDLFTGVGGNAIQFAQRCKHVIAIDIDPTKIDCAKSNAAVYGVDDRIDFIVGDSFYLAPKLKADTVFLSPPWGGPDYTKVERYDIKTMLKPHDGYFLFNTVKRLAPRIVMFLPRNVDLNQLAELSLSATPPWSLEVEKNFLNGKFKAITAYFSDTLH